MHPLPNVFEGLSVRNIVDNDYAMSATVVGGGQGPEALLSSCIPDLQFYVLVVHLDSFYLEINTDCVEKVLVERIFLKKTNYMIRKKMR